MSDIATLLAQLGARAEPAADPALAAVRLARATIDALVLRLGQSIDAKVTAQLAAGLTQLSAGSESFVLKLETPIQVGTLVTVKVTPSPTGQPAVSVTPQPPPTPAAPLVVPNPVASPAAVVPQAVAVASARPALMMPPQAPTAPLNVAVPPSAPPLPTPPTALRPPVASAPTISPAPVLAAAPPAVPAPAPQPVPASAPPIQPPTVQTAIPAAGPAAQPAAPHPFAATPPSPLPPIVSAGSTPAATPSVAAQPAPATAPRTPAVATPSAPPRESASAPGEPVMPIRQLATPYPTPPRPLPAIGAVQSALLPSPAPMPPSPSTPPPPAPAAQPTLASSPAPATPNAAAAAPAPPPAAPTPASAARSAPLPLQQVLADPVQAAARQTTIAPLLAQAAATLVTPAASALPLPVLEALARVMASRIDLNRTPPDGKALRQAVLSAGTLAADPRQPDDMRMTLLALRGTLASFLGGKVDAVAPLVHRPPPPMAGEPPRAPPPTPAASVPDVSPEETARQLLGPTDGALARTKLLQLASSPPDARTPGQATGPELRFEIPMLLGAETGILQLLVQRDGRHKPNPRERGWRMRFAMSFSATGEVGADIALLGHAANISIWAAEPATADALEAMLPELAPALASHGLDVAGLRVRRGLPPRRPQAPGQLLDSAR